MPHPQPTDACPCCGGTAFRPLFSGPDRLTGLPGTFTLARCAACGLIAQRPQPDWQTLRPYYEADYPPHADPGAGGARLWRALLPLGPQKQRRYVERFVPGGDILDVGCGYGDFLDALGRGGRWRRWGLEPTPATARATAERLGVPVFPGRLEDASLGDARFDAVTLWNVLEHVADPAGVLAKLRDTLRPGGHLIIAVPNPESISRHLFGRYWVGWDLPRHLFLYPEAVLNRMLRAAGLEPVDRRCFMNSYTVFGMSLDFWARSAVPAQATRIRNIYAAPPVRAALYPAQRAVEALGRASVVCVTARRQP